ncbi:MAG TPA: hypothetical protein VGB00_03705 [Pyrinomonadaceae bacterium]|jgi:hypothetical protein
MKQFVFVVGLVFVLTVIFMCPEISRAQSNEFKIQTKGKVCSNPSAPCVKMVIKDRNIFEVADLSFKLPAKLTWGNNYYSANFYAIVLKSRPAVVDKSRGAESVCSQGYYLEEERKEIQEMFPANKVFASRNGCAGYYFGYTNAYEGNEIKEFVAVYAGNTEAEAKRFLKKVRAKKEFAGANYRKMQVGLGYGD